MIVAKKRNQAVAASESSCEGTPSGVTRRFNDGGGDSVVRPPTGGTAAGIWVFGYGSLMWRPGFAFSASRPARISGYHRALCVYSVRYRGTRTKPGLVLGLDRGGSCVGRVFRVAAKDVKRTLAYLHEREMPHRVYDPRWLRVVTPSGAAHAYVFVVRRDHPQYTGRLSIKRMVARVLAGRGIGGTSLDYLRETVRHMDELSVADTALHRVLAEAEKAARRRTPPRQKTGRTPPRP